MKKLLLIFVFLFTAILHSQIRLGAADRQKIDSLSLSGDTLVIKIENDVVRKLNLSSISGGGGGSDSGSGYVVNNISTNNYTIGNLQVTNDGTFNGRKIMNRVTANVNVILDKNNVSDALLNVPFLIQTWGADSTVVTKAAGTTLYLADSITPLSKESIVIKSRYPLTSWKADANSFFIGGVYEILQDNFDADAQAFIDAVAILNSTQRSAINDFVIGLKADGLWAKLDVIYPFVGGTASAHKWNLKDPRDLDAAHRLQYFTGGTGSVTHDANGMHLISTSATNYGAAIPNYTQLDYAGADDVSYSLSIHAYSPTNLSTNNNGALQFGFWNGESAGSDQLIFYCNPLHYSFEHGDPVRVRFGGTTNFSETNTTFDDTNTGQGMYTATTSSATDVDMFHNGTRINGMPYVGGARLSNTATNRNIGIGALVNGDLKTFYNQWFTTADYQFWAAGPVNFTATDAANLNTRVLALKSALGR